MISRLLFLRHGQSAYNVLGLCNSDPAVAVPLTETGRAQAEEAATKLRDTPIDVIYVSELLRARETAEIVNRQHRAPIRIDARLNDRNSGFEGRPVADYLAAVEHDPLHFRPPGGESYQELKGRVAEFLDDIGSVDARRVLVVSHHEVLQVAIGRLSGWDDKAMWRWWIDNGDVVDAGEYAHRAPS